MPEKVKPTRPVRRLSKALGDGVKELPTNATWLLSKAVSPLDQRSAGTRALQCHGAARHGAQRRCHGDGRTAWR